MRKTPETVPARLIRGRAYPLRADTHASAQNSQPGAPRVAPAKGLVRTRRHAK